MRPSGEDHRAKEADHGSSRVKTSTQLNVSKPQFPHQENGDSNSALPV